MAHKQDRNTGERDSRERIAQSSTRWIFMTIIFNAILAAIKGIAGFLGSSSALIADAIESTGDVLGSIMVYAGLRYAHKPPDKEHPYGHGRIESVTTFALVGFLLVSAGIIIFNSIENLLQEQVVPAAYTLYILLAVILTKEAFFRFSRFYARKLGSTSLMADAEHHRSDAISSLAALIGVGTAVIWGEKYAAADEIAAIAAACIIIYNAYRLFMPTFKEIMDEQSYPELESQIRKEALMVDGILATEKCYIRKMGMRFYVDLHIIVRGNKSVREGHRIAHELRDRLQDGIPRIGDILIHVEPEEELHKLKERNN